MAVDITVQSATLHFLHSRSFEAREFSHLGERKDTRAYQFALLPPKRTDAAAQKRSMRNA